MKNSQKGSAIVIVLVAVIALAALSGTYWLGTKQGDTLPVAEEEQTVEKLPEETSNIKAQTETKPITLPQEQPVQPKTLTAQIILNSNGFVNGQKGSQQIGTQSFNAQGIVFGDLDGDGSNEAATEIFSCGASCGHSVSVFKLAAGKVLMGLLPGTSVAGAAADVEKVTIASGKISVALTDFDGPRTLVSQVRFVDGKLIVIDQQTVRSPSLTLSEVLGVYVPQEFSEIGNKSEQVAYTFNNGQSPFWHDTYGLTISLKTNQIVLSDLDNDGKTDAVAAYQICGANCGNGTWGGFYVITKRNGQTQVVAKQSIGGVEKLEVIDQIITAQFVYGDKWNPTRETVKYKFINNQLIKI